MISIDESKLNRVDRLGLAYCRLNCWEWDEILGPKPEGFDSLPNTAAKRVFRRKRQRSKSHYIRPAMEGIEAIIGKANTSRCWWVFVLGLTEADWFRWYISGDAIR